MTSRPKNNQSASKETEPPPKQPLPIHAQARTVARTVFAILLVLLSAWVAFDFLPSLAWAVILAIATWPIYERVEGYLSKCKSPVLVPLLFTLATGAVLFTPLVLALQQLAQQSEPLTRWLTELREQGIPVPGWVGQLPIAGEYLVEWWRTNLTDPKSASAWFSGLSAEGIAGWTQALGGQLLHRLFMFFISLIALFILLRDGLWIARRVLETADRILGDPGERLASKMVDAVRSTVIGTISVAFAEGVLIGIAYFIAGLPNALLFTFLTIAFAMLPFGAWGAFTSAALVLVAQDASGLAAGGVFAWGAIVMLVGDHFVTPRLIAGVARLPFLWAFIGIFGGLQVFGLLGLFLGPIIMAALLTVWREWLVNKDQSQ